MKPFSNFSAAFACVLLLSLSACAQNVQPPLPEAKTAAEPAAPSKPSLAKDWWLRIKIAELKSYPVANPPKSISRTTHEGKTAFYITAACCDIPSELYDEEGKLICYPSGGFADGDGRCKSFILGSTPTVSVWQDDRPPKPAAKAAIKLQEK